MRIVIDMQGAQSESRFRGVGRYTLSFAKAIARNRRNHEVILALNGLFPESIEPIRAAFDGILAQEDIRVWHAPGPVREQEPENEHRREVAELIREAFLASLEPDVIHVSTMFEGFAEDVVTSVGRFDANTPVTVSLYDLIPLLNPEQYLDPHPRYKRLYTRKIKQLQRAQAFFAISHFSRKEVLGNLDIQPDKVTTLPAAIDSHFVRTDVAADIARRLRQKFNLKKSFVFCAGGADARKNLPRLVEAYSRLPKSLRVKHQLVLSGSMPSEHERALIERSQDFGLAAEEICFTGYVSDDELLQLYNLCKVYIMPSWHEGFGLPALEAMACGAPVIGANASSLPEVVGRSDALFDPFRIESIQAKLRHALEDRAFREALVQHGLKQSRKFSWDTSACKALASFEQLAAGSRRRLEDQRGTLIDRLIESVGKACSVHRDTSALAQTARAIALTLPCARMKTVFVDVTQLVINDAGTGIQRVVKNISQQLLANPPAGFDVRLVYATGDGGGFRHAHAVGGLDPGTYRELQGELIDYSAGDVFLGLDLNHQFVCQYGEYLEKLRGSGVKVVFVVYDLLPIILPDCFPAPMRSLHEDWLKAITKFDGCVCISRSVANQLKDWIAEANLPTRLRPFDIDWFHLGADIEETPCEGNMPDDAQSLLRKVSRGLSFLTVGTIEPRKGYAQILGAFDLLWKAGLDVNLVIVGREGWLVEDLADKLRAHPARGTRLFWLEGVSDECLRNLYMACSCTIAASRDEGFGLPLIEASRYGLPIVARDIPVFREVAGEHAHFFSGLTPGDLATDLRKWLRLYDQNRHLDSSKMKYLTWKQSAEQLSRCVLGGKCGSDTLTTGSNRSSVLRVQPA